MTNLRRGAYEGQNDRTTRAKADRMAHRPKSLLRWLQDEYALDAPTKLHTGSQLEEDGDPAMTGEAKGFLGLAYPSKGQDQTKPTDWREVACRKDEDGFYVTPMRAAISKVKDPWRRRFIAELATELFDPQSVAEANGIPAWCADDVINASLEMLWQTWRADPLPRRSRPSEAQSNAEAAA